MCVYNGTSGGAKSWLSSKVDLLSLELDELDDELDEELVPCIIKTDTLVSFGIAEFADGKLLFEASGTLETLGHCGFM